MSVINDERDDAFYDLKETIKDLRKDLLAYGNIDFAAICGVNVEDGSQEILGYMHTQDMKEVELLDDDYYEVMSGSELLAALEQQTTD
ncbi:hypothetical protein ACTQ45_11835 [Fundicoccus sp. Sow4_D5]|uniref:hypothetical protein n=1 Tax=Fundicoccus sp. Sow4_D5 TaxID=3438782 RepID=UPI003F9386A4